MGDELGDFKRHDSDGTDGDILGSSEELFMGQKSDHVMCTRASKDVRSR